MDLIKEIHILYIQYIVEQHQAAVNTYGILAVASASPLASWFFTTLQARIIQIFLATEVEDT